MMFSGKAHRLQRSLKEITNYLTQHNFFVKKPQNLKNTFKKTQPSRRNKRQMLLLLFVLFYIYHMDFMGFFILQKLCWNKYTNSDFFFSLFSSILGISKFTSWGWMPHLWTGSVQGQVGQSFDLVKISWPTAEKLVQMTFKGPFYDSLGFWSVFLIHNIGVCSPKQSNWNYSKSALSITRVRINSPV